MWKWYQITHGCRKPRANVLGSPAKRIGIQMRISRGGRWLRMTKQLPDDREAEPEPGAYTRMSMTKVMDAEPFKARTLSYRPPRPVEVGSWLFFIGAGGFAGNHVGTNARQVGENVEGRGIQYNRLFASLAVQ
jgi:hypothetical protein